MCHFVLDCTLTATTASKSHSGPCLLPSQIAPEFVSLGYGYGEPGGYGYGQSQSGSTGRTLLAPAVAYVTERANVQSRVQAGAAWNPSAASIELQEAGQRAQQFYEEGDEILVGPVPSM